MLSHFKLLSDKEWNALPGKLAGSAQPGSNKISNKDALILEEIKLSKPLYDLEIDSELKDDLNFLYQEEIRIIYNLISPPSIRKSQLIKYIWENQHPNTKYINDPKIEIQDFGAPTQEQLLFLTTDILRRLKNGENILVHCQKGLGRTGTILAAIYMRQNNLYDADIAINYIRSTYSPHAIETKSQVESLVKFGASLKFMIFN